jgi:hypothetical protein
MKPLLWLVLLVAHASVLFGQNPEPSSRDPGTDRKLSLCAFRFSGARNPSPSIPFVGLTGIIIDALDAKTVSPYSQEIGKEFQRIYEEALGAIDAFHYTGIDKLTVTKEGKKLSLSEAITENQLCACVRISTGMGIKVGFKKKVFITTKWEILGASGCKLKIETEAVSKEAQGTFPEINEGDRMSAVGAAGVLFQRRIKILPVRPLDERGFHHVLHQEILEQKRTPRRRS